MKDHKRYEWIGNLLLVMLLANCQPYENANDAIEDPEEASYAFGTLNGIAWEADWDLNVLMQIRKGKISLAFYGIQSFDSDLYWDGLFIVDVPWVKGVFNLDLNKNQSERITDIYHVSEYDISVAHYELDKTQENYLKMSPMWGSADYTGELEVHLVKTWSVDYAPPTPDTLHLVVEEFRATHVK